MELSQKIVIEQAIELFLNSLEESEKSTNTLKAYRRDLYTFKEWITSRWGEAENLEVEDVALITKTDIRDVTSFWKTNTNLKPSSINRRIVSLKALFQFLSDRGYIHTNIASGISVKRVQRQNTVKWLTRQEVGRLFHAIETQQRAGEEIKARNRAMVSILVNCGLRVSELCQLQLQDVSQNVLTIFAGKSGKYRQVPLGAATYKNIMIWLRHRPDSDNEFLFSGKRDSKLTPRAVQHILCNYSRMVGFQITPHMLRHTFCKNLADQTGKLELVGSLAGHQSIDTTRIYVTPSMKELKSAVEAIEFID